MSEIFEKKDSQDWTLVIKPKSSWFDLQLRDLWNYRDLLMLFVRRDFVSAYKQTILGPIWYLIQPLMTTAMFIIVFDRVAEIPTDGAPPALFYLSGLVIWNYFSTCINKTSVTFTANAGIFGKVYFPRLIMPISNVISALIGFGIQLLLLFALLLYFYFFQNVQFALNLYLLVVPFLLILVAALGLGFGIIISSLTTKYRDLVNLIGFGINLLMYATPVIYPLSFFEGKYRVLILLNPLTPIIEMFRYSILGVGDFDMSNLVYSVVFTFVSLFIGILIFTKIEKSFVDVV
jgi:lipopolysaccharide transport system permease protein